jgi:hypothetical protein
MIRLPTRSPNSGAKVRKIAKMVFLEDEKKSATQAFARIADSILSTVSSNVVFLPQI